MTPKQELIETLDATRKILEDAGQAPAVRVAQVVGLVAHAQALAARVGEVAKPRKATPKGVSA